jgi:hypothetical protein
VMMKTDKGWGIGFSKTAPSSSRSGVIASR